MLPLPITAQPSGSAIRTNFSAKPHHAQPLLSKSETRKHSEETSFCHIKLSRCHKGTLTAVTSLQATTELSRALGGAKVIGE